MNVKRTKFQPLDMAFFKTEIVIFIIVALLFNVCKAKSSDE